MRPREGLDHHPPKQGDRQTNKCKMFCQWSQHIYNRYKREWSTLLVGEGHKNSEKEEDGLTLTDEGWRDFPGRGSLRKAKEVWSVAWHT